MSLIGNMLRIKEYLTSDDGSYQFSFYASPLSFNLKNQAIYQNIKFQYDDYISSKRHSIDTSIPLPSVNPLITVAT